MSYPKHTPEGRDNQATSLSEPISFRGSLTVPDAYAAISLAQPLGNKIAMWIVRTFFAVGFFYMCWLAAYSHYDGDTNLTRMALAGVVLTLIPICVGIGRAIWYRKRAEHLFSEGKLLYAPTEGVIEADFIQSKSEVGEGTLKWSAFCGYRASETMAVLYQHYPDSYIIMARSKFDNDQDWADFLQRISHALKRQ